MAAVVGRGNESADRSLSILRTLFGKRFAQVFSIELWDGTRVDAVEPSLFTLKLNEPFALRAAFADMLKDADFLAACEQRHFMVDAGTGEEMDAITRETFALSAEVRAKIGAMLNAM